jgi:hypothetical protein
VLRLQVSPELSVVHPQLLPYSFQCEYRITVSFGTGTHSV